jgi:3-dehydroquinate dehydratase I
MMFRYPPFWRRSVPEKPRICIPIVTLSSVPPRIASLAAFFEVRIDLIGPEWRRVVPWLNKPWIACNRCTEEGGAWPGTEQKRIEELMNAVDLGASYADIELAAPGLAGVVKRVKGRAQVIVSHHNFQRTPPLARLKQVVRDELAAGADICKVVTTAHNHRDNVAVLELIAAFPEARVIAFAMGPEGQLSRVLSPLAGGYLTWASAAAGSESAPGQITAEDITNIYRTLGFN